MAKPLMSIKFREDGDEIKVAVDFGKDIPVGKMFALCGRGIGGMIQVCREIGKAHGLTEDQVDVAVLGNK